MSNMSVVDLGVVKVYTTDGRGFTAEEIAERAIDRFIYVSDSASPEIAKQALEYKERIKEVLIKYLREAQESERKTIRAKLAKNGHHDLAKLIGED
jgi:hypothetical protein